MSTNQTDPANPDTKPKRKRQYSDEDKATALAALDANDGNVKRTATQLGIPHKTLDDWAKGRNQNPAVADLRTRKRGSLADKFENLAHLIVDAMPSKIERATLSQCAVSSGIATDKAIRLRGEGLYPDPATELCHLLKINRNQAQIPLRIVARPMIRRPDSLCYPSTHALRGVLLQLTRSSLSSESIRALSSGLSSDWGFTRAVFLTIQTVAGIRLKK